MSTTTQSIETASKEKLKAATAKVKDVTESTRDLAADAAQQASETASEAVSDVRDNLIKAGDRAREVTQTQPLAVVAGALAVGVVIGMAINNRR